MSLREQRRSTVDRQTQGWQAKIKDEFSSWGLAWGYENSPPRLLLHLIINSIYARVATYHNNSRGTFVRGIDRYAKKKNVS